MNLLEQFLKDFCKPEGITTDGMLVYAFGSPKTKILDLNNNWDKVDEDLYISIYVKSIDDLNNDVSVVAVEVWHKAGDEPEAKKNVVNPTFSEIASLIADMLVKSSTSYIALKGK